LPVSAIANSKPVVVRESNPAALQKLLDEHPYQRFPVVQDGKLKGILTGKEAELALLKKRAPILAPAATCLREQTVAALQMLLIESETHFVVVLDRQDGEVIGLVTLHDLLRAEAAMAQQAKEGS